MTNLRKNEVKTDIDLFNFIKENKIYSKNWTVQKQDNKYTDGNGRIRQVKYGTEKNQGLSSPKWKPFWPVTPDDWEIQHVNDPAMEKR